jgi:YhcG PDDEXK nuclease domain
VLRPHDCRGRTVPPNSAPPSPCRHRGLPIPWGDREFFLDLLFHHSRLRPYVIFELKLGRFEPEYIAKLNFYVQLVDDHPRDRDRNDVTAEAHLPTGRLRVPHTPLCSRS